MIGFKLFHVRKGGSLGSLFIDRRTNLPLGIWMQAKDHPTKGFAHRPGWHICEVANAPHLSMRNRAWYKVEFRNFKPVHRPESQGGTWFIAEQMKILEPV